MSQTYADYEIIVVDDGSTDELARSLAQFGDKIRYVYQANGGLSSARNLTLSHAEWRIHRLPGRRRPVVSRIGSKTQVAFLDAHKECGFVHSDVTIIDEADRVIHQRFNAETRRKVPEGYCTLNLLRRSHVQVPTVLERRACIDRVGTFDERLKTAQDYLHWIRIAMDGMAIGYIAEPLAMYRRTASSLSSSPRRVLEDSVIIFEDLLAEQSLASRHGDKAVDIARGRLYAARRELAYLERVEGRAKPQLATDRQPSPAVAVAH